MNSSTTGAILNRLRDTLATAQLGLRDVTGADPARRLGGLRNVAVFGRAVTNVLQNLRSTEDRFDEWYGPHRAAMESDPLMKYFYRIRTEILKEGVLKTSARMHISRFAFPADMQRLGPPPAGAKNFFMGDRNGGTGWEVETANGQLEAFYIDVPGDIAQFEVTLPDAPLEHRGQALKDRQIQTLASLYLAFLAAIVEDAEREFGSSGA